MKATCAVLSFPSFPKIYASSKQDHNKTISPYWPIHSAKKVLPSVSPEIQANACLDAPRARPHLKIIESGTLLLNPPPWRPATNYAVKRVKKGMSFQKTAWSEDRMCCLLPQSFSVHVPLLQCLTAPRGVELHTLAIGRPLAERLAGAETRQALRSLGRHNHTPWDPWRALDGSGGLSQRSGRCETCRCASDSHGWADQPSINRRSNR